MAVGVCLYHGDIADIRWQRSLNVLQVAFKCGEIYLSPAAM